MQNSGDQGNLGHAVHPVATPAAHQSTYGVSAGGAQANPIPPPAFTHPPADSALALRITKLAEYTARNGPAFEAQVRTKQAGSQEYTFLFGGAGTDFYKWCLFCMQRHLPHTLPLPDNWNEPMSSAGGPQLGAGPGTAQTRADGAAGAAISAVPMQHHSQPIMQPPGPMMTHSQPPMQSGQPLQGPPTGFTAPHLQQGAQGMPPPDAAATGGPPSAPGAINPEVASGFAQVLHVLQGSQVHLCSLEPATGTSTHMFVIPSARQSRWHISVVPKNSFLKGSHVALNLQSLQ